MDYLADLIINNDKLLMSSFGGMVLYILLSKEAIIQRIVSSSAGMIINSKSILTRFGFKYLNVS